MMRAPLRVSFLSALTATCCAVGCSVAPVRSPESRLSSAAPDETNQAPVIDSVETPSAAVVRPVRFEEDSEVTQAVTVNLEQLDGELPSDREELFRSLPQSAESGLDLLIATAVEQNPRLGRLYREYYAAAARSQYVDKLPDPKLGANIFGNPIETAAGSQRANINVSQSIPWLGRLHAQQQQACFEAFAMRAEYAAERLRVIAGIRIGWFRLYVIERQIETTIANQELLESLIDVANARIATGNASQGDVLLGTLELSKLEERLLTYRRQRRAVEAEINRLVGRPADIPVNVDAELQIETIELDATAVHQIALSAQPEIEAARLRTLATRWGIEVAQLSRRPEFMLSASYFVTDDNRPPTPVVNVGEDPWAIGVQVSVPIWREKYDAMRNEAGWKHQAALASVEELADRYDALILDLMTEAQRAKETAELYTNTILPQARQTLSADQESYSNGTVEFDRVIRDYRNLLTLELGYHQALGDLAIANAKIQQAAGRDLVSRRDDGEFLQLSSPEQPE